MWKKIGPKYAWEEVLIQFWKNLGFFSEIFIFLPFSFIDGIDGKNQQNGHEPLKKQENYKNKHTLVSSTFNFEEKKVIYMTFISSSFCSFISILFVSWNMGYTKNPKNGPKSIQMLENEKNKHTFFSSTLNFEEMKVALEFHFELYFLSY